MRQRFLNVDVNSPSHGHHGGWGVGMIRGAHGQSVNLVPQLADQFAKITELHRIGMLADRNVQTAGVHVASRNNVTVHRQAVKIALTLSSHSNACNL